MTTFNDQPKIILLSLVATGTLIFVALSIFGEALHNGIMGESSIIEVFTALGYFGGLLTALYYIFKLPRAAKYTFFTFLWAALCFVFFGEETSWLQHLFGYSTPASIESRNLQGEFNLHNLEGFMTTRETGSVHSAFADGGLDFRGLLSGQNLFRLGFLSYFVLLPLLIHGLVRLNVFNYHKVKAFFPLPSLDLIGAIVLVIGLSLVAYVASPNARTEMTEVREMFYALFMFFYVYAYMPRPSRVESQTAA